MALMSLVVVAGPDSDLLADRVKEPQNRHNTNSLDDVPSRFFNSKYEKGQPSRQHMMNLLGNYFGNSLSYLFSSKQYGSQYVQRPGMAKFLLEASDKQWEEGLDVLKKLLQRGFTFDSNLLNDITFSGKGDLTLNETDIGTAYVDTLKTVLKNSSTQFKNMNHFHKNQPDAEISHYFDDKLEEEAKHIREVAGHVVTLDKMKSLGVALDIFDSNL